MIEVEIPGSGVFRFEYLVIDLNGTIALDGEIIEGVAERLRTLSRNLAITLITADTRGTAQRLSMSLPVQLHVVEKGREDVQKLERVRELGKEKTISIGNGVNDVSMLQEAALGICVMGCEGTSSRAMVSADLVIADINSALDLLLKPNRLIATLRK